MTTKCVHCGAERGHFFDCPLGGLAQLPAAPSGPAGDDAAATFARGRLIALPVTLGAALLLSFTSPGQLLLGLLFAMPLHELGHALCAWACGAFAVPLPWLTMGGQSRSALFAVLELAALTFALWKWRARAWPAAVALLVLVVGLLLPLRVMEQLIVFGGDAGALVLGTLLMLTVFLPDRARLARGGLRWGFLVIGACAYSHVTAQWLAAWRDPAELPFGRQEGGALSDATRLVDQHHWSELGLVHAYLALSALCLVALVAVPLSLRERVGVEGA